LEEHRRDALERLDQELQKRATAAHDEAAAFVNQLEARVVEVIENSIDD
jgi:hypothetical protein